jgi:hypothetical protein
MRRHLRALWLVLIVALCLAAVPSVGVALTHNTSVFKRLFMVSGDGYVGGKQMLTGSHWNAGGKPWDGELEFAANTSGKFNIIAWTPTDYSGQYVKVGSGRAYVTAQTIHFKFKSVSRSKSSQCRKAMKYLKNGRKYYYRVSLSAGRIYLYTSKSNMKKHRTYKRLQFGVWG